MWVVEAGLAWISAMGSELLNVSQQALCQAHTGHTHLFWNIAAQIANAVCDRFRPNIRDMTHATAADNPVIRTKLHVQLCVPMFQKRGDSPKRDDPHLF